MVLEKGDFKRKLIYCIFRREKVGKKRVKLIWVFGKEVEGEIVSYFLVVCRVIEVYFFCRFEDFKIREVGNIYCIV